MIKRFTWPVLLITLLIPAVWPVLTIPLLSAGDIVLHLFRVAGLDDAFRQGSLYPRWFPGFAFGYGHAVLTYYSPISYYAVELIHLAGAEFNTALHITFALGFVGAGCALYLFARRFVPPPAALAGAVAYTYFPYHLIETYKRGALAEHMAWIFPPVIFWAATPGVNETPRQARLRAVLFVAGSAALVLTHNLSALIFLPFAFLYYWQMQGGVPLRRRALWLVLLGLASISLSAFYWLPVLAQTRWVQLSSLSEWDVFFKEAPLLGLVQNAFSFDYSGSGSTSFRELGLLSFLSLAATLLIGVIRWRRREPLAGRILFFAVLSLFAAFMTVDLSLPIWTTFSIPLTFLQFPWRFMTLAGFGIAMATALALGNRARAALVLIPLLIATSLLGLRVQSQNVPATDLPSLLQTEFRRGNIGTTWNNEFMPWWVQANQLQIPRPNDEPPATRIVGAGQLQLLEGGYTYQRYAVNTGEPLTLRLHQFYFPPWHASLNGKPLALYPSSALGLLTLDLPPSTTGILEVDYGATSVEWVGIALSLAAGAVLLYLARGRWLLAAAAGALFISVLWGAGRLQTASTTQSIQASVGDVAELIGMRREMRAYHAGETVELQLTWLALRETSENLQLFVHLVDARSGNLLAQSDGVPVWGYTPTTQWRAGELIADTRALAIPSNAAPGAYMLVAGMYRLQPVRNLPATQSQQAVPDGQISLGTIEVSAR